MARTLPSEAVRAYVQRALRARAAQGLPAFVEDADTLKHLAVIMEDHVAAKRLSSA
jgi:hypothetical protein